MAGVTVEGDDQLDGAEDHLGCPVQERPVVEEGAQANPGDMRAGRAELGGDQRARGDKGENVTLSEGIRHAGWSSDLGGDGEVAEQPTICDILRPTGRRWCHGEQQQ